MPESQRLSGFLLINKPAGITSHDVVDQLRRITCEKRIGHSGTLDPFATGLLIVGVGRVATKRLGELQKLPKTYRATLMLGAISDTGDRTGTIVVRHPELASGSLSSPTGIGDPKNDRGFRVKPGMTTVLNTLNKFTGQTQQIPPMYSAKKIAGKKLYELARAGIIVERTPITITITRLDLLGYQWPILEIEVDCSSGTYIRTLAEDIGQALGCGAYAQELERLTIGSYHLNNAAKLDTITPENFQDHLFQI